MKFGWAYEIIDVCVIYWGLGVIDQVTPICELFEVYSRRVLNYHPETI